MGHSKSTKRLPIEKVSFDRAGSSRMHPTHNVFFEELLAIETLAQRPDKMDRWGVPQGAARPSTNPVLLGKAKEAPATRFRAAASGKGVLDMLHTTTPSREGGGGCGRGQRNLTLITPAANQPHGPKASSIPVGCSLTAALPYSDLYLFTGQSKYTLESASSESLLIILAGDQITRVSGSVLPSGHDLIDLLSIGYR